MLSYDNNNDIEYQLFEGFDGEVVSMTPPFVFCSSSRRASSRSLDLSECGGSHIAGWSSSLEVSRFSQL